MRHRLRVHPTDKPWGPPRKPVSQLRHPPVWVSQRVNHQNTNISLMTMPCESPTVRAVAVGPPRPPKSQDGDIPDICAPKVGKNVDPLPAPIPPQFQTYKDYQLRKGGRRFLMLRRRAQFRAHFKEWARLLQSRRGMASPLRPRLSAQRAAWLSQLSFAALRSVMLWHSAAPRRKKLLCFARRR